MSDKYKDMAIVASMLFKSNKLPLDVAKDDFERRLREAFPPEPDVAALREALAEAADQLEAMNHSPAHAASWVKPRSMTTTQRIEKYRALLRSEPKGEPR